MHALVLLCINQYTKFEVPSLTSHKDMIADKMLKTGHVTLLTPLLGVVLHCRIGFDTVNLRSKFDDSSFNRSRDRPITGVFKI